MLRASVALFEILFLNFPQNNFLSQAEDNGPHYIVLMHGILEILEKMKMPSLVQTESEV